MWYVECQYADKDNSVDKWVGLTKEQAKDIHSKLASDCRRPDVYGKLIKHLHSAEMEL
tara:strand:+ start:130 stop:303 length:174 start_codon:yes stop_codon:yes gene_type:complete